MGAFTLDGVPRSMLELWESGTVLCSILEERPDPSAGTEGLASRIGGCALLVVGERWPVCAICGEELGFAFQIRRSSRMLQLFLCPDCMPDRGSRGTHLLREIDLRHGQMLVVDGPICSSATARLTLGPSYPVFDRFGGSRARRGRLKRAIEERERQFSARDVAAWLVDLDAAAERRAGFATREFRSHLGGTSLLFDEDPVLEWEGEDRHEEDEAVGARPSWQHVVSLSVDPALGFMLADYPLAIFRRIDSRGRFAWIADGS